MPASVAFLAEEKGLDRFSLILLNSTLFLRRETFSLEASQRHSRSAASPLSRSIRNRLFATPVFHAIKLLLLLFYRVVRSKAGRLGSGECLADLSRTTCLDQRLRARRAFARAREKDPRRRNVFARRGSALLRGAARRDAFALTFHGGWVARRGIFRSSGPCHSAACATTRRPRLFYSLLSDFTTDRGTRLRNDRRPT